MTEPTGPTSSRPSDSDPASSDPSSDSGEDAAIRDREAQTMAEAPAGLKPDPPEEGSAATEADL